MLFCIYSVADSENQIKIGHRNLESQQNDNIPRSVGETLLKQEKLQKRSKSTKCYIHFHNFLESYAVFLFSGHASQCFFSQVMHRATTHQILEKRSCLLMLPNIVQHRYSECEN